MAGPDTFHAHGLSLPGAFSPGQAFGFSGFAGENFSSPDWCGALTGERGEIRFGAVHETACGILLRFTERTHDYDVVTSDLILSEDSAILVTFADAQTLVGRSDTQPAIRLESEEYVPGSRTIVDREYAFSLAVKPIETGHAFALCRRADADTAASDAQNALGIDADAIADVVLEWYFACPPCPLPGFEKLWFKCLSVNRVNTFSPQNGSAFFRTTSDRLLHRDPCLSDACCHSAAMVRYAPDLAKDVLLAVLEQQREDGFIPQSISAQDENADAASAPMLCASIWNLFEATGDFDLLRQTAEPLCRCLEWDLKNRRSPNGLIQTDASEPIESVERSVFMAYELLCMQQIYMALDEHMSALRMDGMQREMAERINMRLWDRQTQCYYDRTLGGAFRRILTPASFLPLFAGLCDPRQAHCLVTHLTPLLDLPFPIPPAADEQGKILSHGFRQGVRLQDNFFVYVGLQRYGFGKLAADLRRKTLEGIRKQFRETGCVPALYDPLGGSPLSPAGDNNTSACFTELLIWS